MGEKPMEQPGLHVGTELIEPFEDALPVEWTPKERLNIPEKDLAVHTHMLGKSGVGKSWLMKHMLAQEIQKNAEEDGGGFCLIDPDGEVFDFALRCVAQYPELRRRIRIIDTSREDYFVGLNYLEYDPEVMSPAMQAEMVIAGLRKAFGGEDEVETPRMDRIFRIALIPLILESFTFAEFEKFVAVDPTFRNAVLTKLEAEKRIARPVVSAWRGWFDKMRPWEKTNINESTSNWVSSR